MHGVEYPVKDVADFEKEVREICDLAFAHGMNSVGYTVPSDGKEKYARFVAACHEGYALAQSRLLQELLKLEDALIALRRHLKDLRRTKNRAEAKQAQSSILQLETRRHILKKIADGLAWTILGCEDWKIRRFYLGEHANYLRATNPESVKQVADERNKNPMRFALITDLTSCIQIGDILEIDFTDQQRRVIEVKEGVINEKVYDALDSLAKTHCERIPYLFAQQYGRSALKQMIRVLKQHLRVGEVLRILETGKGHDLFSGKPLFIPDKYYIREDWITEIDGMERECEEGGFSARAIDGCLLVGMFSNLSPRDARLAFAHTIYHLEHPEVDCLLETAPERGLEELHRATAESHPILDLAHGLTIPLAMPIFLWPVDKDLIMDIVFRRKTLLFYLDFDKLFKLASRFGIKCHWEDKHESWPKVSGFFSKLGRRLALTKSGNTMFLGTGTLTRITFGAERPISILPRIAETLDSCASDPSHDQESN